MSANREPGRRRALIGLMLLWQAVRSRGKSAAVSTRGTTAGAAEAGEQPERAGDRTLEPIDERRLRWGTLFVACAFLLGTAGALTFLFAFWTGGSNLLLGGSLAAALGGFGATLILWARWLMPDRQAIAPREALPSSPAEREAVLKEYCAAAHEVRRRTMLKWMSAAGLGLLASMVISLMRSLGISPDRALFTTVWQRGQRLMTADGKPITAGSLAAGDSITVFPENSLGSEKTQTVLIRVQEQLLDLPPERAGWAPLGYVAYSRVCTHAGCPVGIFEADTHLLLCPCHQSTFDVLRGAQPTGGPAARPLPQLPLYADSEGNLRAADGFTAPPGPGFWGLTS